jgi:hypothetical protein
MYEGNFDNPQYRIWTTRNGRKISVGAMSIAHITNIIS